MIKSHLLCQLSYGEKTGAKIKIKIERREEKEERREEKGERRKEKGERRKEKGERRNR